MKAYQLLGVVAGMLVGAAANATLISHTIDIDASNFSLQLGPAAPAPVSPLLIDFSVSFDNAASINSTTAGLIINSFNLPYSAAYAYNSGLDTLVLATNPSTGGCGNPPSSFCIFISSFSTSPDVFFVQQSTASGGYWSADTIVARVDAVPEPGTVALLGLGLAAACALRRRARHRESIGT